MPELILISAIVVIALCAIARIVHHQRRDAQMHRFVDRVMAPRVDQQTDRATHIEQR